MAEPFFDTCIIADWLRRRPEARAELQRYRRHRISRIVWTRLLSQEPLESRGLLEQVIAPFAVVEIDARIASAAADLCQRMGVELPDALILATTQVNGSILITRNTKVFPANMPGIRVPYSL